MSVYYTLTHLSVYHLTRECVFTHLTCVGVCYCVRPHLPCIGALSRCLQTAVYNTPVCVFAHSTCQCVCRHPVDILKVNPSSRGLSLIQLMYSRNPPDTQRARLFELWWVKTLMLLCNPSRMCGGDQVHLAHSRLCNHQCAPKPAVHHQSE